jgi:hypothetical protein
MTTTSAAAPRRHPGRLLLALGLAVTVLSVAGYAVQLWARHLTTPWYVPAAATVGVILLAASLWQARTVWRWLALVLVLLLAGAEWAFLLAARLPPYTGPAEAGRPFPAFTTARADGNPFTQRDLKGDKDSVLVFFRGRW